MKQLQALWKFIIGDSRSVETLIQETKEQRVELERLLESRRHASPIRQAEVSSRLFQTSR